MLQRWLIYLSTVIYLSSTMEHVLNSISVTAIVYLPQQKIWGLRTNEEDSLQTNDDGKKS